MSGKAKQPDQELMEILSGSRRKWQELIGNLASETPRSLISPAPPNGHSAHGRQDVDTLISPTAFQPQSCKPGLERLTSDVFCGPLDTETISHRNERLLRTAQVMERLTRVERQNHKIMVLIFALTITAFVFLLMETTLLPKGGSLQMTQSLGPSVASGVTTDPRSGNPVTGAAAGKYAGVKTSNDYHLPGCEAAQTAAPEVLTAFDSVAAAKQQGFKPCPVCRPPNTD